MAGFIGTLTQSVVDYQVGVITLDMVNVPANDGACDPCCDLDTDGDGIPDFSNCDGGRLASADGHTRILKRPTTTDPTQLATQTQALIDEFNAIIDAIGTNGDAYERSFQAMQSALGQTEAQSPFAIRAANFGFLRPTADLAVIIMSDEDECSNADLTWYNDVGRNDADCYVTPDLEDPQDFVNFLSSLKGGDIRHIRAAAIVGDVEDVSAQLGFSAKGCITGADGDASDQCGCFAPIAFTRTARRPSLVTICSATCWRRRRTISWRTRTPRHLPNGQGGCQKLPGSRYRGLPARCRERPPSPGGQEERHLGFAVARPITVQPCNKSRSRSSSAIVSISSSRRTVTSVTTSSCCATVSPCRVSIRQPARPTVSFTTTRATTIVSV